MPSARANNCCRNFLCLPTNSHDAEQPPPPQENGVENKQDFSADAVTEEDLGPQRVSLGSVLIVVALSFHSIFEGLSLGLQSTDQATWIMFLAISIHKFVIAFVVGFDMKASRMRTRTILIYIAIFSVMSPLGALIGAVTKNKLGGLARGRRTQWCRDGHSLVRDLLRSPAEGQEQSAERSAAAAGRAARLRYHVDASPCFTS
ncbi:hypothetical protein MTO96_004238 [Rhipicephalus appendiculatus]